VLEAAVFAAGAVGFAAAGHTTVAAAFVVLAVANWALLFAWRQDP
jgi:hypothetical protein